MKPTLTRPEHGAARDGDEHLGSFGGLLPVERVHQELRRPQRILLGNVRLVWRLHFRFSEADSQLAAAQQMPGMVVRTATVRKAVRERLT